MTELHSLRISPLCILASALSFALLTGCSSSFDPLAGTTPPQTALGAIQGVAYGGRGPIQSASIYVYQVSTTTYGGASTLLAGPVLTDANGKFNITSYSTTCTSGIPVYLYSKGGNAGGGTNTGAGLMAALGPCPSSGTLAAAFPYVNMNELSTVAMAFSLSGFAVDATHIGYSGSALGLTGITNAFNTSKNIFNVTTTIYPTSSASATTGATTGSSTGTLPQKELNTLADILAQCINSVGGSGTPCSTTNGLFYYATSNGTAGGGTIPADSATAAINIAQHPTANISGLYGLAGGTGSPYQTALTSAPSSFAISIAYSYSVNNTVASEEPRLLAVDAAGNIWSINGLTTSLVKFSPLGVASSYSIASADAIAVAVDNAAASGGTATVYVAFDSTAQVHGYNSSTGASVNSFQAGSNSAVTPDDLSIDGSGNLWTSNEGDNAISKHASTGTGNSAEYTAVTAGTSLSAPTCIGATATGNIFVANYNDGYAFNFPNSPGTGSSLGSAVAGAGGAAVAVDNAGNAWFANYGSVNEYTTGGTLYTHNFSSTTGGIENSDAMDGSGNVWVSGVDLNSGGGFTGTGEIYKLTNTGSSLSVTADIPTVPPGAAAGAGGGVSSVVVDGSGNVWYNNLADDTIRELVGAATPVATPLSYGAANNKLGQKP